MQPLSLYIHIPWCVRKCPYCDFNSHAIDSTMDEDLYVNALLNDLAFELPTLIGDPILDTIFIGGGTPSLFSSRAIDKLLQGVKHLIPWTSNIEITLEANPGTIDSESFEGFFQAGINRLSMGVQSFDNPSLLALGRIHDKAAVIRAYELARAAGFTNINMDLMFGLPQQSLALAATDLQQAIALAPEHLSYYQLTMEPNTAFYQHPPSLPSEDNLYDIEKQGHDLLAQAGYQRYEISAFSRPSHRSRHNLNYWHFGSYLGIGAGAHGMLHQKTAIERRWRKKNPKDFMRHAGSKLAISGTQILSSQDKAGDFMLNNLRLIEGFDIPSFESKTGLSLTTIQSSLDQAKAKGLIIQNQQNIKPTARGLLFLNDLIAMFFDDSCLRQQ